MALPIEPRKKTPINVPVLVSARQILDAQDLEALLTISDLATTELKGRTKVQILMVDAVDDDLCR